MSQPNRLEQINIRLFGLEGRVTTMEKVYQVEAQARKELLESIIENQKTAEERLGGVERKMAFYAGIGVVIGSVAGGVINKVITLIK